MEPAVVLDGNVIIHALVIEDMLDDVLLLQRELRRGGYSPEYKQVDTRQSLTAALRQEWDIIFCDYSMPNLNGLEALRIVRQYNQEVPFIFVSGTIGEDIAVEAMRIGAQDYIMKDNLRRLVPAVQRELADALVRRERRNAEKQLHFLANFDSLTNLPNRLQFLEKLTAAVDLARLKFHLLAVAYLDLDRFKTANDSLGYQAGNMLLQETAKRLCECVGDDDVVARLAADEFVILLTRPISRGDVIHVMERIQTTLGKPFDIHGCSLYKSASMGIAMYPFDAESPYDLLRNADIATYRAKDEGGHCYRFFNRTMAVQLDERLALEQAMRTALHRGEFLLHFQPQVDMATQKIIGVEVLVRWDRPGEGLVSPGRFIPLAEETGLIIPLGDWVLRHACQQLEQWRQLGIAPMRMAVNVSARQFHQDGLAKQVIDIINEYHLEPSWLELEITETSIMRDTQKALSTLKSLQQLGVQVALDDFGTGYSSLSYLKHFKVNSLKIDQSFVRGIPQDKNDAAIAGAVIAMAHKLDIQVIAEGIETREQFDFLRAEGCDVAQGYYLSKPLSAEALLTHMNVQRQS